MLSNFLHSCICNLTTVSQSSIDVEDKNKTQSSEQNENINDEKYLPLNCKSQKNTLSITPSKIYTTISPMIGNVINGSCIDKNYSYKSLGEKFRKKKYGTCKATDKGFINEKEILDNFYCKVDGIIQQFLINKSKSESEDSESECIIIDNGM